MVYAANKAIYLIILLSAAPIAIATFIGLLIGLLQTITQIQEQTLPFCQACGVFVCLLMMMGWMGDKLLIYAKRDVDDWVSRVTIMLVLLQIYTILFNRYFFCSLLDYFLFLCLFPFLNSRVLNSHYY